MVLNNYYHIHTVFGWPHLGNKQELEKRAKHRPKANVLHHLFINMANSFSPSWKFFCIAWVYHCQGLCDE